MPEHELHDVGEWKAVAREQQQHCYEVLGDRVAWSGHPTSHTHELQMRLALLLYGPPPIQDQHNVENSGYRRSQVHRLHHLAKKVAQHFHDDLILLKAVYVSHNLRAAAAVKPVFYLESRYKSVFMDTSYRVYRDWKSFLDENDMPDCHVGYPVDGRYEPQSDGHVRVEFSGTPASHLGARVVRMLDVFTIVLLVVGATVSVGSREVEGVNMSLLLSGFLGTALVYYTCRLVYKVIDILRHW